MFSKEDLHVQVRCLFWQLMFYSSCNVYCFVVLRSDKEEKNDLKNFKIKAQNMKKKREILKSIYSE